MKPRGIISRRVLGVLGLAAGIVVASPIPEQLIIRQASAADADPRGPTGSVPGPGLDGMPQITTSASRLAPQRAPAAPALQSSTDIGNPLWTIPLSSLTATRERPIFSPSRRPPVVAQPAPVKFEPPPAPVANLPSRPLLTLLGAIVGDTDGIAIFMDETTKSIVRMKTGESHSGWMLRSVAKREATMEMARQVAVLVIPVP